MRQGSFVRKGLAPVADPGTRPGLHGQTLLSSGHADLDRLLGGGLPLGSLLLLLEDGWSGHHTTLLRYFLAEGAACGQAVLLAAAPLPSGGLAKFVPAQLMAGRSAADREEEEGGREQDAFKLRIAWQYRRYIKTGQQHGVLGSLGGLTGSGSSASGSGSGSKGGSSGARKPAGLKDWCHQFDLLKVAGEEGLQQCRAELADCSCSSGAEAAEGSSSSSSTQRLVSSAAAFVQSLTPQTAPPQQEQAGSAAAAAAAAAQPAPAAPAPPRGPQHVGRIAVLSLGSLGWQLGSKAAGGTSSSGSSDGSGGGAVLRALLQLKALARDRRCAVAVSVPAALFSASDLARMQHIADGVIALESVADDSDIVRLAPDAASVAGLLHLRKLPSLGTAAPPAPEAALHLVRHKRRRLAITPVEICPDAELADAEAASSAGKSVASVLCSGPAKADSRAMDF